MSDAQNYSHLIERFVKPDNRVIAESIISKEMLPAFAAEITRWGDLWIEGDWFKGQWRFEVRWNNDAE